MYLVMKRISNAYKKDYQSVMKAYKNIDNAVNYIKNYISESSTEWRTNTFAYQNKKKTKYYRYLKDGQTVEIFIKYMKLCS